jgi:hypothetical protein
MLVPSVSSLTYIPPARSPALRAVGATAPVAEPRAPIGERELSADEERIQQQMRSRDRELRVQERAYVLLGGTLLRTLPSHTYERGPDGRFYAIAAEATIDTSSVGMLDQDIAAAQAMFAADPLPVKAAAPAPVVTPDEIALDTIDSADAIGGAVARFYLSVAGGVQRPPVVDLFA